MLRKTDFTNVKCDGCGKDKLTSKTALRKYDSKGIWTGRWLCNKCYQTYYKYSTTDWNLINKKRYNDTNTCDRCGIDFDKTNSAGRHYKEYKDGKWTGNWLCNKCYSIDDKKRPDNLWNLLKLINEYTKKKYKYNKTETCDRCGIKLTDDTYPRREFDKDGNWTGKWDCYKCYSKFDPNSKLNLFKSVSDRRTGNQNPNSTNAKGDKFQKLTCIWLDVKDLNIENDFHSQIDHSKHPSLGILQTKGKLYDSNNNRWDLNAGSEHGKNFDNLIFYCASEDGKFIERVYIFPWSEVLRRSTISIYNSKKNISWTEEYRIKDDGVLEKVNGIWKEICLY